jgi:uridine kinase
MEGLAMNTIFIGIAGGTGSGKTTLTEHLKQHFGDDISVVHHDSYYKISGQAL